MAKNINSSFKPGQKAILLWPKQRHGIDCIVEIVSFEEYSRAFNRKNSARNPDFTYYKVIYSSAEMADLRTGEYGQDYHADFLPYAPYKEVLKGLL